MHRLQFCLHICAYAKLECRANKHADDSSVDLFIERDSRRLRCVAVDESYLLLRHASFHKKALHFGVGIELSGFRRGVITENYLCAAGIFLIYFHHLLGTYIRLSVAALRQFVAADQTQIKRRLSPVRADLQHVVIALVYLLLAYFFRALTELIHIFLKLRAFLK